MFLAALRVGIKMSTFV